jgi:hypothetical protein
VLKMGYTPPWLNVNKIAGGYSIYPPNAATTEDLNIYANTTDATSRLELQGLGNVKIYCGSGSLFSFVLASTEILTISYTSPDLIINGKIADKNIFLNPAGTGKIKFGTYTAGAATDSTGYIDILDAAGNARKLMVQA